MAQLRRQFSLARLLAAVAIVAIVFASPLPWQMSLSLSIGMLIPLFVSGLKWWEIATIQGIAFVLGGLMVPAAITIHRP